MMDTVEFGDMAPISATRAQKTLLMPAESTITSPAEGFQPKADKPVVGKYPSMCMISVSAVSIVNP
jgi:hypothetical protein